MKLLKLTTKANLDLFTLFMLRWAFGVTKCIFLNVYGQSADLTAKELDVPHCFLENFNQLIS